MQTAATETYFVATKFWGAHQASVKPAHCIEAAVAQFNANRARKGVERVLVATRADLNAGVILDSWRA